MTDRDLDARVAVEIFGLRVTELRLPSWAEGVIAEGIALPTRDYYVCDEQGNTIQAMYQPGRMSDCYVPHYATDMADAWLVVEKMRKDGWQISLGSVEFFTDAWKCTLWGVGRISVQKQCSTLAEAICLAAIESASGDTAPGADNHQAG